MRPEAEIKRDIEKLQQELKDTRAAKKESRMEAAKEKFEGKWVRISEYTLCKNFWASQRIDNKYYLAHVKSVTDVDTWGDVTVLCDVKYHIDRSTPDAISVSCMDVSRADGLSNIEIERGFIEVITAEDVKRMLDEAKYESVSIFGNIYKSFNTIEPDLHD